MTFPIPSSVYGPVNSWRLGRSLGIDVLCVDSICSFDCVYCQLGKINRKTDKREIFISTEKIIQDLKRSDWKNSDVITFSGSGEPTLAKNLGEVIREIKELTKKPMVVLTNSTLLDRAEVRQELMSADKVFCKLDAWSIKSFQQIDRPTHNVNFETMLSGIRNLSLEHNGFIAIQTMILRPVTDLEVNKFADILNAIQPGEVQLNTPSRPKPVEYFVASRGNSVASAVANRPLKAISAGEMQRIRERLSERTEIPIITRQ